MPKGLISTLKFLIGWPLSLVALIFVFKLILSQSVSLKSISSVNSLLLILSVFSFIVYFFLRSLLWHWIIKAKGNKFSYKQTSFFWQISEIKRYVPGNIWSFVSRADLFSKDNIDKKAVASSLVTEAILLVISCLALSYFYLALVIKNDFYSSTLLISNVIIFLAFVFLGRGGKRIVIEKKYLHKIVIYFIAISAFFVFGLATYFGASAIVNLNLKNINIFLSLFVFSYLAGYLSFITPMGLGVREATVTFALSKFVSASASGIVSIFTRILLIVSELLFFGLVFFWFKFNNGFIGKVENFVEKNKHMVVLSVFILIYIFYFTTASFLRYDNFYTGRFDLGNMDQTVWNTTHGRIFQLTDPDGIQNISRLSVHADFILVLISPLYFLWSDPRMLLLLQTVVLAFGALFVYKISYRIINNKNFSLLISSLYLLYPALMYTNLYDFHPITLATTFLLGTFYFFIKKDYKWFLIFALLSAFTKEEVWGIIAIFGIAFIVREVYMLKKFRLSKEILFGSALFLICVSVFYLLIAKLIPLARGGGEHFAISYYSDFGASTSEVFKNILLNPLKTFSTLFQEDNRGYLAQLFGPLGYLSIIAFPILIFAMPDFGINLLSSNHQLHQIYYQYSAAITPFIFISAIYAVKLIRFKIPSIPLGIIALYLIVSSIYFQYITGPLPGSRFSNIDMFTKPLQNKESINGFLKSISSEYSIASTNNIGSHLSEREDIYTIPKGIGDADFVIFLIDQGYSKEDIAGQRKLIYDTLISPDYRLIFTEKNFFAFKKIGVF